MAKLIGFFVSASIILLALGGCNRSEIPAVDEPTVGQKTVLKKFSDNYQNFILSGKPGKLQDFLHPKLFRGPNGEKKSKFAKKFLNKQKPDGDDSWKVEITGYSISAKYIGMVMKLSNKKRELVQKTLWTNEKMTPQLIKWSFY